MATSVRDWYLGALGVVRYLPRDISAAAVDEVAVEALEAVSPPPSLPPSAQPREDSRPREDILPRSVAATRGPTPSAGEAPRDPGPGAAGEIVEFRLAFWQPSAQLVVLSAMPPTARPTPGQQDMLARLLTAIKALEGALPSAELIDWPIGRGRPPGLEGARELVATFLEVKMSLTPFRQVLLMGDIAARVAAGEAAPQVGLQLPLACGAGAVVTHSLFDMERDPALKRDTWEAIRFLAGTTA